MTELCTHGCRLTSSLGVRWRKLPRCSETCPRWKLSSQWLQLQGHNVKAVEDWAVSHLPRGPALYPKVHPSQQLSTDTSSIAYVQSTGMRPANALGLQQEAWSLSP